MGKIAMKTKGNARVNQPKTKTVKKSQPAVAFKAKRVKKVIKWKKHEEQKLENGDDADRDDIIVDVANEQGINMGYDDKEIDTDSASNTSDEGVEAGASDEEVESSFSDEDASSSASGKNFASESSVEDAIPEQAGSDSDESSEADDQGDEAHDHQAALLRLKDTDPEFYKFLQENDKKLLQFNISDSEQDSEDEVEQEDTHVPGALEVASDESDFEGDGVPASGRLVTLTTLQTWQKELCAMQKSNKTIIEVVQAFNAVLRIVSPDAAASGAYVVRGASVFNGVVQICVLHLGPAINSYLRLEQGQQPHKSKRFAKIKTAMKQYFTDLHALMNNITSGNILNVLLKHLHYMTPILTSFPNNAKSIAKKVIMLWGSAKDESVRVIAFLCVLRLVRLQRVAYLDYVLKTMYITYVNNAAFVSVNTLPSINFMRRSLVEIYALDAAAAYPHVFLYLRQLAIAVRTAIVGKKVEHMRSVCNWQFVNSCRLWGSFIGQAAGKPQVESLLYPFVQICFGTLKLVPTEAYYPMRFHMVQVLMDLSRDAGVFIPLLPFLTDVLTTFDFNRKHSKISMKPVTFDTVLRMSKAQMSVNGFKDAIIDAVQHYLLEYLTAQSHSIAFPELALFAKRQIKIFLKRCSVVNYKQRMQQLLLKVEASVSHIEAERIKLNCRLDQTKKIEGFEAQIKSAGTPLSGFFEKWRTARGIKRSKQATNNEEIGDYDLPVLMKKARIDAPEASKNTDSSGKVVLFPSDSEDDEGHAVTARRPRGTRAGKNRRKVAFGLGESTIGDDADDIVEDITNW